MLGFVLSSNLSHFVPFFLFFFRSVYSGKIFFNNYNLLDSNISLTNLRIQIGMVFQHFNLFSEKTVL
ncbi:MAG: hypothetical protein Q8807_03650, partial ['Waltheria sp.' little leaf phytoplasma]|nr:hypothetical protein ['Waltheria sp.' little leaf phytoplasma]